METVAVAPTASTAIARMKPWQFLKNSKQSHNVAPINPTHSSMRSQQTHINITNIMGSPKGIPKIFNFIHKAERESSTWANRNRFLDNHKIITNTSNHPSQIGKSVQQQIPNNQIEAQPTVVHFAPVKMHYEVFEMAGFGAMAASANFARRITQIDMQEKIRTKITCSSRSIGLNQQWVLS